jgi:hypothetical protein
MIKNNSGFLFSNFLMFECILIKSYLLPGVASLNKISKNLEKLRYLKGG